MLGTAAKSPARRGITDIAERIALLDQFAEWADCQQDHLVDYVDSDLWRSYWGKLDEIERLMAEAQMEADLVREQIARGMEARPALVS